MNDWRRNRPSSQQSDDGRLHNTDMPYVLPTDDHEVNRMDFQHYALKQAMQGALYLTPVQYITTVLDVGTGSGRWAIEIAQAYPHSNVVGLDMVAPPPAHLHDWYPENYTFVQGNILEQLPFASMSFDFIHQRMLNFGINFGIPRDK